MLIFDSFPSVDAAQCFADYCTSKGVPATVYTDVASAQATDPIPVPLAIPVVHVERSGDEMERHCRTMAAHYGGHFVGT